MAPPPASARPNEDYLRLAAAVRELSVGEALLLRGMSRRASTIRTALWRQKVAVTTRTVSGDLYVMRPLSEKERRGFVEPRKEAGP